MRRLRRPLCWSTILNIGFGSESVNARKVLCKLFGLRMFVNGFEPRRVNLFLQLCPDSRHWVFISLNKTLYVKIASKGGLDRQTNLYIKRSNNYHVRFQGMTSAFKIIKPRNCIHSQMETSNDYLPISM